MKNNIYKFLYFISILLIIGFVFFIVLDYLKYDISYSAPFYIFIIEFQRFYIFWREARY